VNGLDCRKCSTQIKKIRGCDEEVPEYTVEGIKLRRCPLVFLGRRYDLFFVAYSYFQQNILPFAGGWGQQPNVLMQAIRKIDECYDRMKDDGDKSRNKPNH
jgi:hypothetical protein